MRLFIATTFPEEILRSVNDRVARIRSRLPPVSWTRPETQHLTFAFLGEQDESLVASITDAVEARLKGDERFSARLHGSGFFPNARHARVGWVGVEPAENFSAIAQSVREAVRLAGVVLDGVDFKPHLTLCRIRDHWPPACVEIFQHSFAGFESVPFDVEEVTLFSSRLDPAGAVHTPLRKFKLGEG